VTRCGLRIQITDDLHLAALADDSVRAGDAFIPLLAPGIGFAYNIVLSVRIRRRGTATDYALFDDYDGSMPCQRARGLRGVISGLLAARTSSVAPRRRPSRNPSAAHQASRLRYLISKRPVLQKRNDRGSGTQMLFGAPDQVEDQRVDLFALSRCKPDRDPHGSGLLAAKR
jgi:hypothetical protein